MDIMITRSCENDLAKLGTKIGEKKKVCKGWMMGGGGRTNGERL